jgi:hypothetical protein
MKMHEWHAAGLEPAFATVDEWIIDQLGRLEAEELASYAIAVSGQRTRAVRILVATDIGLFDVNWTRAADPGKRWVAARHLPWWEVAGLQLEAETRLDPETMTRQEPTWSLTIREPQVEFPETPAKEALVGFWKVCREQMAKARGIG